MKHSLQLKLGQSLALTPQLQQSIRLLQLSTLELQQEVKQLIQDNPLLEIEDDEESENQNSLEETGGEKQNLDQGHENLRNDDEWHPEDRTENYGKPSSDIPSEETQASSRVGSLSDHLAEQLTLAKISEYEKQIVLYLIGNLDENGFLKEDLSELLDALPTELNISQYEIEMALQNLQALGPAGIGARNLSECLKLQLDHITDDTPHKKLATILVTEQLDALAARDYGKLKRFLRCDDKTLKETQKLIQSLNPRPGSAFNDSETRYITPDVFVKKINSKWTVSLNVAAKPKLKINQIYADILKENKGENFQTIKNQLTDAKWFIKNIEQRYETILRVSQAIVDQQYNFFEYGDLGMQPLVLREIASKLDLHESTISRVTTQKYMMTPRGILELKYFFGSHVTTQSGSSYSSTAIRALIKKIVEEEDKRKPASDSQISKILASQGIVVARRTVAKYRESLQILPVNLRKDL